LTTTLTTTGMTVISKHMQCPLTSQPHGKSSLAKSTPAQKQASGMLRTGGCGLGPRFPTGATQSKTAVATGQVSHLQKNQFKIALLLCVGVDVMITIFYDFSQFSAKKLRFS
jgi:hypothetical protein